MAKKNDKPRKVSKGCGGRKVVAKKIAKPKKQPAGYILYFTEVRKDLVKKNPKMKPKEIARLAGEGWRKLSQCQRDQYNNRACKQCPRCALCKRPLPKKK